MNRRFFLKSAAGAVLAAPLLTSLREDVRAAEPVAPRRSVIFGSGSGCITNRWFPKVEHGPLTASAFEGTSLASLAPFADKLLIPRGLRAINAYGKPQTIHDHIQANRSKLTCALIDPTEPNYALSHSLDWEIARQMNPGAAAPLVFAYLPVDSFFHLSFSAALTPVPATRNPREVFDRLSGVLVGGEGEGTYLRRRGQSVLDAVRDDLGTYQRLEMSAADRRRVEAWSQLLRESELGLGACDPTRLGLDEAGIDEASVTTTNWFTTGSDMMMKLIALTMLCDTNRSFVMSFPPNVVFNWDGIEHGKDHDGLGHRTGSAFRDGACVANVVDMITEIDVWYAKKFTKLVSLLASVPEGDATLLDSSVALWVQEFSDGAAMNLNNMPIVIAGSAGGYLAQGMAVNVEGSEIGPGNSLKGCGEDPTGNTVRDTGSVGGNVPINKLYVTLLNALGCRAEDGGPVERFGQLDGETEDSGITNPGELTQLRA